MCIKETNKIVKAMETKIEALVLGGCEGAVILDIMTLIKYSGRGRCGEVTSWYAAADKCKNKILKWAKRINWDIREIEEYLRIKRVPKFFFILSVKNTVKREAYKNYGIFFPQVVVLVTSFTCISP